VFSTIPSTATTPPVPRIAVMRHRDGAKDEWRKREHLRYGRKPDVEDGNHRHPRRIRPPSQDVDRRPFDNYADHQSGGQHQGVTIPPRIHEPIASAERRPAGAEDEKDEQTIAQARKEAVPFGNAEIVHTFVEGRMRQFPGVVNNHSEDEDSRDGS
jgi:hypothetical protein